MLGLRDEPRTTPTLYQRADLAFAGPRGESDHAIVMPVPALQGHQHAAMPDAADDGQAFVPDFADEFVIADLPANGPADALQIEEGEKGHDFLGPGLRQQAF